MSNNDPVDLEVAVCKESNETIRAASKEEILPLGEGHLNKQDQNKDAPRRKGKRAGRPRKPRPEILSLEEYDRNDEEEDSENSDADEPYDPTEAHEKPTGRKRGRPRSKPLDDGPRTEKKKRGRPKDETRSNVTCELCGKFFKYRVLLKRHEQTHYGIKEFECEICHKRFLQKGGLTVHLRQHTGERPYKCPYCPASFRGQSSLDCHVFRHTKQGTKCPQCPSVFATPAIVKQHIREVHTTEKPHTCQICGESYKHRKSLTTHLEDHDKRICTVCGKVFNTMFALMTHRHIHDVNPKCSFCNKSFKSDEELVAHSKLRGRVYQCELCCYSFNKSEFLNNHHRRDHWKELGLERLARRVVPRPKKPKPEGPKGRQFKPAFPIITLDVNAQRDAAPEKLENALSSDLLEATAAPIPNEELPSIKRDLQTPINVEPQQKDNENQDTAECDFTDFPQKNLDDMETWNGEGQRVQLDKSTISAIKSDELNTADQRTDHTAERKIKAELESQVDETTMPFRLEPEDFVEVKLDEPEKSVEIKREEALSPKENREDPIDKSEVEERCDNDKNENQTSESEDDDIPLATLGSALRTKRPAPGQHSETEKILPVRRSHKLSSPEPSEDSSDDDKLYFIGDPSDDSDHDSSSIQTESEEEQVIEEEKAKPKRKGRRKRESVQVVKRPYQKRNTNCMICGEVFQGRAALNAHRKAAHADAKKAEGPFICELCGKKYATVTSLAVHRSQHKEYQRFKCDECPKAFTFQCYLDHHIRVEHRQERLICPLCGKQFKYGPDLKRHTLQHEEEKPFKCEECPAAFRHPSALHSHKAIHEKLVFTCDVCNKNFRYANSLRVHKRLHSGVKRFKCEICDREFSQKAPLMKHMTIHSVDRQVKCIVCDKVYYKKVELTIHQAKEHPNHPLIGKTIKIHPCKICGMEFTKENHLKIHTDIHGDEYRFKCDMCEDQKFKQMAGLRHHWKHFHHMEPPKRNLGKKPDEKKVEKVVVRTVMGSDLKATPPVVGEMQVGFEYMMQRMECTVTMGTN